MSPLEYIEAGDFSTIAIPNFNRTGLTPAYAIMRAGLLHMLPARFQNIDWLKTFTNKDGKTPLNAATRENAFHQVNWTPELLLTGKIPPIFQMIYRGTFHKLPKECLTPEVLQAKDKSGATVLNLAIHEKPTNISVLPREMLTIKNITAGRLPCLEKLVHDPRLLGHVIDLKPEDLMHPCYASFDSTTNTYASIMFHCHHLDALPKHLMTKELMLDHICWRGADGCAMDLLLI